MKKIVIVAITVLLLSVSLVAADYTLKPNNENACWSGLGYMNSETHDDNENTGYASSTFTYGGCQNNYYELSTDNLASATGLKMRFLIDYNLPTGNYTGEEGYINVGCADEIIFGFTTVSYVDPKPITIGNENLSKQWYEIDITQECLTRVKNNPNDWIIGFEWQGPKFSDGQQGVFTIYEHELLVEANEQTAAVAKSSGSSRGGSSGGSSIGASRYYINDEGKMVNANEEQAQKAETITTPAPKQQNALQKIQAFDAKEWFSTIGPKIKGWLIK